MHKSTPKALVTFLISLVVLATVPAMAQAPTLDSVQINDLDDSQPVQATAHVSVLREGRAVTGLPPEAFTVYIDDEALTEGVSVQPAAPGLAVAVLVDISGSMDEPGILNGKRLLDARQLARDFVEGLNEEDWVALIGFGADLTPKVNLTYDHGLVLNTLAQLPDLAGPRDADRRQFTHLFDAVAEAVDLLTDNTDPEVRGQTANLRKIVLVFSDGNDTQSSVTRLDAQRAANEDRVSVYTVTLCSKAGQGDSRFKCQADDVRWLTSQTNGEALALEAAANQTDIQSLFGRLSEQRNQYLVHYEWHASRGMHMCRIEVTAGGAVQADEMDCSSKIVAPQIAIVTPANATRFARAEAGPVDIAVSLSFPDGTPRNPTKIEYFVNGNLHQTVENPPWDALPAVAWDMTELDGGDYTLLAVLHDPWTETESGSERVKISLDPFLPPEISLTAPFTEVVATDSAVVTFIVDAVFPDGVARALNLVLRDEGRGQIAEASGLPPFTVTWPVQGVTPGEHIVAAEVTDPATGTMQRSEAPLTVKPTIVKATGVWLRSSWYWLLLFVIFAILMIILWRRKPTILAPVTTQIKALTTRLSGGPALARLVVLRGPQLGEYPIRDQMTTIGRNPDVSSLVINGDPTISGRHATIMREPTGQFFIRDEGSSNGTYLNYHTSVPVQPNRLPLNDGDILTMGQTQLQFHVLGKTTQRLGAPP